MKFAGDAVAFGEDRRVLRANASHAYQIDRDPEQRCEHSPLDPEPDRLRIARPQRKRQIGNGPHRDPWMFVCDDTKAILTRWDMRVVRDASRPRIDPVLVVAGELISEANAIGRDE